ncbi:beta-galactosidase [Cytophaga sp. FL35]|uniref:GH39 family glycosyl hydrolase n=1 Tax=Cytophaga sp. FL35 TaxID=1904456 RepID=UPI001653A24A|nr:beta-galactosidase [Cytophaga sp. FL35]MBC7000325.1 beta-galactosidase [Cytophaga sp. FL35]
MKTYFRISHLFVALIGLLSYAQNKQAITYNSIGLLQPRSSNEITASNWSIGGETMDRDFTDFDQWKQYLGATGAKKIRLQAGWAKCERKKGEYNFEWLDKIIDEVIAQGVEPWLQTSYGNPIYEGGGMPNLSGGFPVSEEALTAWDQWVMALVNRYKGRVKIWEIWNESDLNSENTPEAYSKLFVRTAEIIKSKIPEAKIYALSLAHIKIEYVAPFLNYLKKANKLHLVDVITLHGYTYRPEEIYPRYEKIQHLIQTYSDHIIIGQGELGCPSENQSYYALKNYPWTETSQSKWLLRKLLGDLGRDIPSLYFTIIDMNYVRVLGKENGKVVKLKNPIYTVNTKGLIKAKKDNTVDYLKPSYFAYQNLTSIFDHSLKRIPNYPYVTDTSGSLSVYGYRADSSDYQVVTIWENGDTPNDSTKKTTIDFEFSNGNFDEPVYVDMRTGEVYEIPKRDWTKKGTYYKFSNIPIYDSPILIAEKSLIKLKSDKNKPE